MTEHYLGLSPYQEAAENPGIRLPENVSLSLFMSSHMDRDDLGDFAEFRRKVKRTDVLLIEMSGWAPAELEKYRKIAEGDRKTFKATCADRTNKEFIQRSMSSFTIGLYEALYASNRIVGIVDVPNRSRLAKIAGNISSGTGDTFDETVNSARESVRQLTLISHPRELFIMENLDTTLNEIIRKNPRLHKKDEIKVLMMLGAAHLPVYNVLSKRAGDQRAKNGSDLPSVSLDFFQEGYDPGTLLAKHYLPHEDFTLTHEQVMHTSAQVLACSMIRKLCDEAPREKKIVEIAQALSFEEIRELYEFKQLHGLTLSAETKSTILEKVMGLMTSMGRALYDKPTIRR